MRILRRRGDGAGEVEKFAVGLVVEMQVHAIAGRISAAFRETPCRRASGRNNRASTAGFSAIKCCAMHQIGVMPMPPANRTTCSAFSTSGKLLRGALILSVSPDAQLIEDVARAAAAVGIELDADHVALWIVVGIEQRELADEPVWQMDVDMRAGFVGRQRRAVGPGERIDVGVARHGLNVGHAHVYQGRRAARSDRRDFSDGCCCNGIHEAIDSRPGADCATRRLGPCGTFEPASVNVRSWKKIPTGLGGRPFHS